MDTLQGLTQLNQVPVDMTLEGLRAINQRQQADTIGLQESLRKQQYERAMDPMRLQQQQIANDQGLQTLGKLTRENKEADFVSNAKMQADLLGHLVKASDSDLKMAVNKFQELAYHPDPKMRKIGEIGLLQSKEAVLQRQKDAADVAKVGMQGRNAEKLMQMQIDAGRFKKNDKLGASFEDRMSKFKKAHEQHQALVQAALMARQDGNEALAESYEARANAIRPQAEAELRMLQQPGQVDVPAVANLPATPQGSIAPPNGGSRKLSPAHEDWVSRAMKANPGMSREDIIKQGETLGKFK